jgi:hypothetical protein
MNIHRLLVFGLGLVISLCYLVSCGFGLKRKMNHNRSAAEMAGLTVLNLSGK